MCQIFLIKTSNICLIILDFFDFLKMGQNKDVGREFQIFQVFRKFLWNLTFKNINYSKEINKCLINF